MPSEITPRPLTQVSPTVVALLHAIDNVRLVGQCERAGAPVTVTRGDVRYLRDLTRKAGL